MIYGYARVSSTDQSLNVQREALFKAGCENVREETESGKSMHRPVLRTVLEFMREGDILIVTKLDRLSRNTVDMLTIIQELGERKIGFKSLAEPWADTTSPAGKLMLTVFAGVAQFERERLRERQREGIDEAQKNGVYKGGAKRYDDDYIRSMRAAGKMPAQIVHELGCSKATVKRALARVPLNGR